LNEVVLLKSVKIGSYGGRSLSVTNATIVLLNPENEESRHLKLWLNKGHQFGTFRDLSNVTSNKIMKNWKLLNDVTMINLNNVSCMIAVKGIIIDSEISWYKICPKVECKTKVINSINESVRCLKCDKLYTEFIWRIIYKVNNLVV
jgi:hypothetical protein